jgi:hypothetical protein
VTTQQPSNPSPDQGTPPPPESIAQRIQLRFYTHAPQHYHMVSMHEGLLLLARRLGVDAAVSWRDFAGFGRFTGEGQPRTPEAAAGPVVIVELLVSEVQEQQLLELLAAEKLPVAYTRQAVEYHEVFCA